MILKMAGLAGSPWNAPERAFLIAVSELLALFFIALNCERICYKEQSYSTMGSAKSCAAESQFHIVERGGYGYIAEDDR
jgi:hypothetical protein